MYTITLQTTLGCLLTGLGFKPTQPSLEVPDLTGLDITGTTVAFFVSGSIAEPPFAGAGVTVLPVLSFSGFNPLFNQSFTLPAGATLTMITELRVAKALRFPKRLEVPSFRDLAPFFLSPFDRDR